MSSLRMKKEKMGAYLSMYTCLVKYSESWVVILFLSCIFPNTSLSLKISSHEYSPTLSACSLHSLFKITSILTIVYFFCASIFPIPAPTSKDELNCTIAFHVVSIAFCSSKWQVTGRASVWLRTPH